jgi:hypothetical protein
MDLRRPLAAQQEPRVVRPKPSFPRRREPMVPLPLSLMSWRLVCPAVGSRLRGSDDRMGTQVECRKGREAGASPILPISYPNPCHPLAGGRGQGEGC